MIDLLLPMLVTPAIYGDGDGKLSIVLARSYYAQGDYARARLYFERSLVALEGKYDEEHLNVAFVLGGLANVCFIQEEYTQAKPLFERALDIYRKKLPPEHPALQMCEENYAECLRRI